MGSRSGALSGGDEPELRKQKGSELGIFQLLCVYSTNRLIGFDHEGNGYRRPKPGDYK